ncbi:PAS domain-containing sensor histidine kinase [Azospirillum thermophilum]|nr:PAS domain-containing protein [Azospirillum thermophilum]
MPQAQKVMPAAPDAGAGWAILDAMSGRVCLVDADGRVVAANRAWQADGGRRDGAAGWPVGSRIADLDEAHGGPDVRDAVGLVLTGTRERATLEIDHCCGTDTCCLFVITGARLGGGPAAVVECIDVSEQKRLARDLARQKTYLRQIIDQIPHFIFVKDAEGRHLLANRPFAEAMNLSVEAFEGRRHDDFPHRPRHENAAYSKDDLTVLDTGRPLVVPEEAFTDAFGRHRLLQTTKVPFRGLEGEPTCVLGISVDVTETRRIERELAAYRSRLERLVEERTADLERSRAVLRSLLDSIPDMIFFKDRDGRYLGCNTAFAAFAGRPEAALAGKDDAELFAPWMADGFRAADREVLAQGRSERREEWIAFPDGSRRLVETVKAPFFGPGGDVLGLVGVARDVTLRHEAELRLMESTRALEDALRRQKELNETQRKFVAMVSHEFRTPLAIIDGAAQLVLRHGARMGPGTVRDHQETIRAAVARARHLIETTLAAASLDAGAIRFTPGPVDLHRMLEELVAQRASLSKDHRIALRIEDGLPVIQGDQRLLHQVFNNLLSNAAKYSPAGGGIEVTARPDRNGAVVEVSDHGVGIPEDEQGKVFERFFRASTSAGIPGTGLGLNVAKELVAMHGGDIALASGGGTTTFQVRLPLAAPRR